MSKKKLPNDFIHIATLGKTVGVRGDMKFHIYSDFDEQFIEGAKFYISADETIDIEKISPELDKIKLLHVNTPEEAKKLTNRKLYSTYDMTRESCHLQEGEYFWFDIMGCDVYEAGEFLGKVEEIERISISDYLKIATSEVLVNEGHKKHFLTPYMPPFLLSVDIESKKIELAGAKDILSES